MPSARELLENPWAAKTLALATATQASEVMRDVCLVQATDGFLGGQTPVVALAGLATSLAVPKFAKPARHAAQKCWQAHSQKAAGRALRSSLSHNNVSSTGPLTDNKQQELQKELRSTVTRSINLTTEATEGLCGLLAQGCVLGASPTGQCVAGALLSLAVAAIILSSQADGQDELCRTATLGSDAFSCTEICEQLWRDDSGLPPGHAVRVDECTERLARLSKTIRRHDSVKCWTSLIGRGLAFLPVLLSMHAVFISRSATAATHMKVVNDIPAAIDTIEEWRILLHLAIWLPMAAHHISCTRRLLHAFRVQATEPGTHGYQSLKGDA